MHSVFAMTNDEFFKLVPDYWKPFLRKQEEKTSGRPEPVESKPSPGFQKSDSEKVVYIPDGKKVLPPKPEYTPDPLFSEASKELLRHGVGLQGVVDLLATIDQNGKVERPYIIQPLGLGLDEQALAAVKAWRFKPGTKDGHPVAVRMKLEISFKLYN